MDNHTMDDHMAPHNMAGMASAGPSTVSFHAGIPPASDPKEFARAVARNPVAPAPSAAAGPIGATIRILPGAGITNATNTYSPTVLTIKRGTTVAWVNTDPDTVHNVGDDGGAFTSTLLKTDNTWAYTYKKPGVYPFHCLPRPWMKSKIIVK